MESTSFPVGAGVTLAELETDPHPALARLRQAEPVSWVPVLGGWLVTRRDLTLAVMRDSRTFTVDDPRFSTARVVGPSMLSLDGAVHTRHRKPFTAPFRPADVEARFAAFVSEEVDRLIESFRLDGRAELRRSFAGPLAVAVVAEALGLPETEPADVLDWYAAIVDAVSTVSAGGDIGPRAVEAVRRLGERVGATVDACPHGSLLAEVAAPPDGLATSEVVSNAAVLMFGGIDTTEGTIANVVLHLLSAPDQLAAVVAEPGLLANAVEESMRLEPAAAVVDRYATRDVTLGTAPVAAGDLVVVSLAGANRDPAVFAEPDAFDVRRPNARQHLAFAHGPHFCLGIDLARLETITAVRGLLTRLPDLELDPAAPRPSPSGLIFRKPPALHVRWTGYEDGQARFRRMTTRRGEGLVTGVKPQEAKRGSVP